ncbi:putative late blight resistance protein homolog r1a-6 [Phtheirospermum japonicum]|uniref:Putative late blight resistance protein homolog r1a-6 n=1 Tax=Phtheirospermum japonicum TaxID=374723 RepID=A0A830CWY3_9LAMI|nr:putative late blight resistance protein homolog r1a-6 [Phtheirospermum japonicum]
MAAYAALISLRHIIEHLQHNPRPPISLDNTQLQSITEKVTLLQDFLEGYCHGGSEDAAALESRIAETAYVAEDIIESRIVNQIHETNISSIDDLYQDLQKLIQALDLINRDANALEIRENKTGNLMPAGSLGSAHNTVVGLDDVMYEIMDKLTGQQSNGRQIIIPVVGMGGIGKTTLARNVYVNPLIVQHFDILAWVTISHDYNVRTILLQVLLCLRTKVSNESLSEDEIGEKIYKILLGRRYLIIMDDMWSIEAWDKVKFFFPDNYNNNDGSKIMITTRTLYLALQLTDSYVLQMSFLDDDQSWNLLYKTVFGEGVCPLELEQLGKKIARNCKGLPLSIIVIGGVLANSERTQDGWKYVADNLNSIVNLEDSERCLKILHMSYNQLPIHLKPCFLYMGIFPQDCKISVSWIIKLWVAEGFLKPSAVNGKTLEMVALDYLEELIDRNLILVHKLGSVGNIKLCTIHDLLRDLCLRVSVKEKFYCVLETHSLNIPHGIHNVRRIGVHGSSSREDYFAQALDAMQAASLSRSLIFNFKGVLSALNLRDLDFRLLRVLKADKQLHYKVRGGYRCSLEDALQLVNSRHLAINAKENPRFPSSVCLLWNLQTLVVNHHSLVTAPPEIWKMPQLRHVRFSQLELHDPPWQGDFVLGNLQSLSRIRDFKCGEEVVKRIPNIKKLGIYYKTIGEGPCYHLNNLVRLRKLESLSCSFYIGNKLSFSVLVQTLVLPHSLKKLTLVGSGLSWEEMKTKIGLLPLLEVLKLRLWSFKGPEWETVEGQFCRLKFLLIQLCDDLEYWRTDSTHFPRLENLVLRDLDKLKEIPSGIGDIHTLRSIELDRCSDTAIISANEILKEQEELGNVGLQVQVRLWNENRAIESLASPNFRVEIL